MQDVELGEIDIRIVGQGLDQSLFRLWWYGRPPPTAYEVMLPNPDLLSRLYVKLYQQE
jgi:hypothetical protein